VAAVTSQARAPGRLLGGLAAAAGWTVGKVLPALRTMPGLVGAAGMAYGASMIYLPAGVIAGGAFLLLMDRRI
jgi:hypothetical protein